MTEMKIDNSLWYIVFETQGKPIPQGSMTCFANHPVYSNQAKLMKWRKKVNQSAKEAMKKEGLKPAPSDTSEYMVDCIFRLVKPKSNKKQKAGDYCNKKPDIDKLLRAVNDAITYVCFEDDSRVVSIHGQKRYVETEEEMGVTVIVNKIK